MNIGYILYEDLTYEGKESFEKAQLKMALTCERNGWCMEDGYDEDGKRYLVINPPYEPPLEELKATKFKDFKFQRDAEEVLPIEWDGNVFDYDFDSRERMRIKRQDIEDKGGTGKVLWTLANNERTEIGLDEFKGINGVAAKRSEALHDKYNLLKTQVEVAASKEELMNIVW